MLSINVELQEKGLKRIYAATKWFDGVSTCVIDELIKTLLNIFFIFFVEMKYLLKLIYSCMFMLFFFIDWKES